MFKTAFLFPGQGSQYPGMITPLMEVYPAVREIFNNATVITGIDLFNLCDKCPEDILNDDINAQLVVFVYNIGAFLALKKSGFIPDILSGYSLGLYSAMTASGSLRFEDGVRIIKRAGEIMLEASREIPGSMGVIFGLPLRTVEDICKEVSTEGQIYPSNINASHQIVISGEIKALNCALEQAIKRGALNVQKLQVKAAYHSPLMKEAALLFAEELKNIEFTDPEIPVMSYVDCSLLTKKEEVKNILPRQLPSRILWKDCMLSMYEMGVRRFVEVGPGEVLTRLLKWTLRDADGFNYLNLFINKGNSN